VPTCSCLLLLRPSKFRNSDEQKLEQTLANFAIVSKMALNVVMLHPDLGIGGMLPFHCRPLQAQYFHPAIGVLWLLHNPLDGLAERVMNLTKMCFSRCTCRRREACD
jgi:hypothetical protein